MDRQALCQWVQDCLEAYIAGEIRDDRVETIEKHLRECLKCREQAGLLRSLAQTITSHAAPDSAYHLSTETLLALVLSPELLEPDLRSRAQLHLQLCENCARDFHDARDVAQTIGLIPHEEPHQAERRRSAIEQIEHVIRLVFARKLLPVWAAGALAALVLTIGIYVVGLREGQRATLAHGQSG